MNIKCNTCESPQYHLLADLYQCKECDLISSENTIFPDIYDHEYILKYVKYSQTELGAALTKLRVNQVLKYIEKDKSKTLLDFGCGSGDFVLEANKHFTASGYDINPSSPWYIPANLTNHWDIVTFWDSLEHTDDPKQTILSFSPEYIFIAVPCTDDFPGEDYTQWKHYRPHEHIHYYSERALRNLLLSVDYKILDVNFKEADLRKGFNGKNIITIIGKKEKQHG